MRKPTAMIGLFFFGATLSLASTVEAKPKLGPQVAGVGDVIYHADLKAPLPNAWGKPDIFGGKIVVGKIDVRYLGLSPDGLAQFQRSEVQIVSNETTMTRGYSVPTVATAMQPVLINLTVDLKSDPTLVVNGQTLRVIEATGSKVTYEPAN